MAMFVAAPYRDRVNTNGGDICGIGTLPGTGVQGCEPFIFYIFDIGVTGAANGAWYLPSESGWGASLWWRGVPPENWGLLQEGRGCMGVARLRAVLTDVLPLSGRTRRQRLDVA